MKRTSAVIAAAALVMLAGCSVTKDENGKIAQYTGTMSYSNTNWTVNTNDGEIVVTFDGPFSTGWEISKLAKNTKIAGHDDNSITFDVTKSGTDELIVQNDMHTDGCVNRQSLTIDFTADSNKRMYDVTISPSIENVLEKVTDEELDGLSEDEQDALYSKVSEENAACMVKYDDVTSNDGTFTDDTYEPNTETEGPAETETAQSSASASAESN